MPRLLLVFLLIIPALLKAEALQIFVSVPPLKTFVEKVAGPHASVHSMVKPGHNPAPYEPGPQQISQLASTDFFLRIGMPYEKAWMPRIQATNPAMQIIDAQQGITMRRFAQRHQHDGHAHHENELDPHIWTSPVVVTQILLNIEKLLTEALPEFSREFAANRQRYTAELQQLDQQISQQLHAMEDRKFMVFHPSWGYFADRYELEQIAIEKQGKEPGARMLSTLINQAKQAGVKVVFVQPQFSRQSALQIARAIDGKVIAIDPLATDYTNNLRQVAQQLAEALQ